MKQTLLFLALLFAAFALVIAVEHTEQVKADTFGSTLIGWWTLDSNKVTFPTPVVDSSGQGITGSTFASPPLSLGRVGQSLTFNGTTQYVVLYANTAPASVNASIGAIANGNSYSFSAWIKTSNAAAIGATAPWAVGNTVIEARTTAGGSPWGAWSFGTENGKLATARAVSSGATNTGRVSSTASVNDNKWHFVVATANVNAISLYIDGKLDTATTIGAAGQGNCSVGQVGAANVYLQIGARTTNAAAYANFFSGQIDDVRVYNTQLSANDVAALYNLGLGHSSGAF